MTKPKYTTFTGIKAEDIPAAFTAPLPPPAFKGVPGGADLTDINTGYMIERVTEVFGPRGLGWNLLYDPANLRVGDGNRPTARLDATFTYALWGDKDERIDCLIQVSGVNQNDAKYVEEGVRTSAIGAALKWLCFQNAVYKGQYDHHDAAKELQGNGNGSTTQRQPATAGNKPTTTAPANGNGATTKPAVPVADDNVIATAGSKAMVAYGELCQQAKKAQITPPSVDPGKTTVGQVRKLYGQVQAEIEAKQVSAAAQAA